MLSFICLLFCFWSVSIKLSFQPRPAYKGAQIKSQLFRTVFKHPLTTFSSKTFYTKTHSVLFSRCCVVFASVLRVSCVFWQDSCCFFFCFSCWVLEKGGEEVLAPESGVQENLEHQHPMKQGLEIIRLNIERIFSRKTGHQVPLEIDQLMKIKPTRDVKRDFAAHCGYSQSPKTKSTRSSFNELSRTQQSGPTCQCVRSNLKAYMA